MQFATLCTIFQSLVYLKLTSIVMLSLETKNHCVIDLHSVF